MDPSPRLSKILTLTCEEATFLASESLDRRLTIVERLASGTHEILCIGCKRYHQQLHLIREAVRAMDREVTGNTGIELPGETREKIQTILLNNPG